MDQPSNQQELAMTGKTFLTELATQCRIGCDANERKAFQPILIDISCETDMAAAIVSDKRSDCVDYCDLRQIALELAEKTAYRLLEKLAYEIAQAVLKLSRVQAVTVEIRKPHKLAGCKAVGISLTLRAEETKHA